jgi:hypothetical protein
MIQTIALPQPEYKQALQFNTLPCGYYREREGIREYVKNPTEEEQTELEFYYPVKVAGFNLLQL